jgi:hypothetical protein
MMRVLALLSALLLAGAAHAQDYAWLELTGRGQELRAITSEADCPYADIDGQRTPMKLRGEPREAFPVRACALAIPAGASKASVGAWTAPLRREPPKRILIFGDTGCRLKGTAVQACNDPRRWPFALVAQKAAAAKPDLVIHVGDYYYRESPCPAPSAGCAGSPFGDTWASWDADFFAPARPLLEAAPWVLVRGNHESCARGWRGWFLFLDEAAEPLTCPTESAPFKVKLGDLGLYVLDSATTVDREAPESEVDAFARQLETVKPEPGESAWILTHRPTWAMVSVERIGPLGPVRVAINRTQQVASEGRDFKGVEMIVAGHIHHFASYDFGGARPAQLVAGTGGDVGDDADSAKPTSFRAQIDGMSARAFSFMQYGYLLLERDGKGWTGVFRDLDDKPVANCRLDQRQLACHAVRR